MKNKVKFKINGQLLFEQLDDKTRDNIIQFYNRSSWQFKDSMFVPII